MAFGMSGLSDGAGITRADEWTRVVKAITKGMSTHVKWACLSR